MWCFKIIVNIDIPCEMNCDDWTDEGDVSRLLICLVVIYEKHMYSQMWKKIHFSKSFNIRIGKMNLLSKFDGLKIIILQNKINKLNKSSIYNEHLYVLDDFWQFFLLLDKVSYEYAPQHYWLRLNEYKTSFL